MIENHGHANAFAGTVRRDQNFLPFECALEVVHFESHMRDGLDDFRLGRIRIEPHPLNAAWAGFITGNVNEQPGNVYLVGTRCLGGNADMVITPAVSSNGGRRVIALARGCLIPVSPMVHLAFHRRFSEDNFAVGKLEFRMPID